MQRVLKIILLTISRSIVVLYQGVIWENMLNKEFTNYSFYKSACEELAVGISLLYIYIYTRLVISYTLLSNSLKDIPIERDFSELITLSWIRLIKVYWNNN